jgi:hypothetical protein
VYNYGPGCQIGYEFECDFNYYSGYAPTPCAVNGTCEPPNFFVPLVTGIDLSEAGFFPAGTPLSYSLGYNTTTNSQGLPVCGGCLLTNVTLPRGSSTGWPSPTIQYTFPNAPYVLDGQPITWLTGKTLTHTDPYTGTTYTDTWQYCAWFGGTNCACPLG